jgi:hypothetical protein
VFPKGVIESSKLNKEAFIKRVEDLYSDFETMRRYTKGMSKREKFQVFSAQKLSKKSIYYPNRYLKLKA